MMAAPGAHNVIPKAHSNLDEIGPKSLTEEAVTVGIFWHISGYTQGTVEYLTGRWRSVGMKLERCRRVHVTLYEYREGMLKDRFIIHDAIFVH